MLDIEAWLNTTGISTKKLCFIKPPTLPYCIFREHGSARGTDEKNLISERSIAVELYTAKIDSGSEKKIENLLNNNGIEYDKDQSWIDSEKLVMTIYEFDLTEKMEG